MLENQAGWFRVCELNDAQLAQEAVINTKADKLPVRKWMLSVPKRLRYFMQRDGPVLNMVLRIYLRVTAQSLQSHSPSAAQWPLSTASAPA